MIFYRDPIDNSLRRGGIFYGGDSIPSDLSEIHSRRLRLTPGQIIASGVDAEWPSIHPSVGVMTGLMKLSPMTCCAEIRVGERGSWTVLRTKKALILAPEYYGSVEAGMIYMFPGVDSDMYQIFKGPHWGTGVDYSRRVLSVNSSYGYGWGDEANAWYIPGNLDLNYGQGFFLTASGTFGVSDENVKCELVGTTWSQSQTGYLNRPGSWTRFIQGGLEVGQSPVRCCRGTAAQWGYNTIGHYFIGSPTENVLRVDSGSSYDKTKPLEVAPYFRFNVSKVPAGTTIFICIDSCSTEVTFTEAKYVSYEQIPWKGF